jgi:hypothetical protein
MNCTWFTGIKFSGVSESREILFNYDLFIPTIAGNIILSERLLNYFPACSSRSIAQLPD